MEIITEKELELLKICWKLEEATVKEILKESLKTQKRHYSTVKTILDIMVKKGFLTIRKVGPVGLYSPNESKSKFIGRLVKEFVENVLNGDIVPIFVHFSKTSNLSEKKLECLREIIENMDEDD